MQVEWKRNWPVLAAGLAVVVLFFVDPAEHGFFPQCLFHRLTGWNCPGCGATRAAHELLRGHWATAFHDNALLLAALPLLAWLGVRKWLRPERKFVVRPLALWALLVVVAGFGVVRNLPGFEWLSP
jgi:hypothetical protein